MAERTTQTPPGWYVAGSVRTAYVAGVDPNITMRGSPSGYLKSTEIFTRRGARWMGYVSVYNARWNVHSAAMDYYLLNQYWGQGIARQAVTGVLSYCWTDLGLHRVEAQVDVDNARSIRFAERLGMVYEGTQRHGAYVIGAGGIAASTRLSLQTRYSVRGVADPEGPGYASSASLVAIAFRIGRAVTCRLRSSVKTRSSTLVRSSSGSRCHRLPRRVVM